MEKLLLKTLSGQEKVKTPVWLMRQAGRSLPEYKEYRKKYKNFMHMCLDPEAMEEITLQPIRRFDYDAAIVFSDILVIPYALGQDVSFVEDQGPLLGDLNLKKLSTHYFEERLRPVSQGVQKIKEKLPNHKALIGFVGAPWTLSTYMIQKKTKKNFDETIQFALKNSEDYQKLINILIESCIKLIIMQVEAGAEVIQIFDSWASFVPDCFFDAWVFDPVQEITQAVKGLYPHVPLIFFPKGAEAHLQKILSIKQIEALSFGSSCPVSMIVESQKSHITQGNLDPNILFVGGDLLQKEFFKIKENLMLSGRHIFNLGHGVLPDTPLKNIEKLLGLIRS